MPDIVLDFNVDMDAWDAAVAAMIARLQVATGDASMAAAGAIKTITQGKLLERTHSEFTFSPAAVGEPPAAVSGALAASIDTARVGPDSAIVGPTNLRYARIQELGGPMHGHPFMVFHKYYKGDIRKFKKSFVQLGPRPYLEPATEEAVDSGLVRDLYVYYWASAIEG